VLATAPSNLAVDNLVERLAAAGLACVRVGHPARVLPAVLAHTLEARTENHEAARIARGLVEEAIALRRSAAKRRQKRGPGRFSASRGRCRRPRAFAEARSGARRGEVRSADAVPARHRLDTLRRPRRFTPSRRGDAGGGALYPRCPAEQRCSHDFQLHRVSSAAQAAWLL
jgi:hypothetical protein